MGIWHSGSLQMFVFLKGSSYAILKPETPISYHKVALQHRRPTLC